MFLSLMLYFLSIYFLSLQSYIFDYKQITKQLNMFKRTNEQQLLKRNLKDVNSGSLNKLRILQSIPLKKLNDSQSNHSSVMTSSLHSSIKNVSTNSINSFITNSEFSFRSSLKKSQSKDKQIVSPQKKPLSKELSVQQLLQKYYSRSFVKSLVQFLNKDWGLLEKQYLAQKKLQNYLQIVFQRGNWLKDLSQEFIQKEYGLMNNDDRKMMASILFHEQTSSIRDIQTVIPEIIKKIPEQKILKQQTVLQQLQNKLLQIYDPKFSYSNNKIKERLGLYLQQFIFKRNQLKSDISIKLKSTLQFIQKVQSYFNIYQREVIRLKNLVQSAELEKEKYNQLLNAKSNFAPLQVDYDQLYDMREKAQQLIKHDLQVNIIQFHEDKHNRNNKIIQKLEEDIKVTKDDNQRLINQYNTLKEEMEQWKNNIPSKVDASVQVFLITQSKQSESMNGRSGSLIHQFLDNVVTPFSFSKQITSNLISILTIDKILYDYEVIKQKLGLKTFQTFIYEWFIIRTGCKKIAQVFIKNFQYSLKEFKGNHKRFWIFQKICGWNGFKHRNMQQDLQGIFFSSHLCWYYLVRLALLYRKKLNENPTGYHIFPPLPCEQIFKIPLRKIYELIEQFLIGQQLQVPNDLTSRIDRYCINEVSKFKNNDEQFQKQQLQEIHILKQINFDLIAGFALQYVCHLKCTVVQKVLRTIQNRQKEEGHAIGYNEFQILYKKFYKEKRAKIELIYAKLCLVNQHQMLNVQNIYPVALAIIQDQNPLRSVFQKLEPLRALILSQKANIMRGQKKILNPNSYENFRERFYHQFYDFYSTTAFLQQIFKIIKVLTKKILKNVNKNQIEINNLLEVKQEIISTNSLKKRNSSQSNLQDEDQSEGKDLSKKQISIKQDEPKNLLVAKLQEWNKIIVRVPHFTQNVLTIDQIVIHNMRRKQMIDISQFAWRILRQILIIIGKD